MDQAPARITDATAWHASDFPERRAWAHHLTPDQVAEIAQAIENARAQGLTFDQLTKENFSLPKTADMLRQVAEELEEGRGFAVVAGWPVREHDYDTNLMAFAGVGTHLGQITEQNHKREKIIDVTDKGLEYSHRQRGYSSNKRLPFHTDGADVVGLLCLGSSAEGGISLLSSSSAVYNRVAEERPDLLPILERGFHHHRRGEEEPGEPPISAERVPVFSFHDGLLHCCYNRNPIQWAEKEGVTLSEKEIEALDYFDRVAESPECVLEMDLQLGDMQFVNNYAILHSRTDFLDKPETGQVRHLLRLWLNTEGRRAGWTLQNLYAPLSAKFRSVA